MLTLLATSMAWKIGNCWETTGKGLQLRDIKWKTKSKRVGQQLKVVGSKRKSDVGHTRRAPFSQRSSGRRNAFRPRPAKLFEMGNCSYQTFRYQQRSRMKHCRRLRIIQPTSCPQQQPQAPTYPPSQPLTLPFPHPKPSTSSPLSMPFFPASSFPPTMATFPPPQPPPKTTTITTTTTRALSHLKT